MRRKQTAESSSSKSSEDATDATLRRAVEEALLSTLVLRKAKSAVSESLSASEAVKRRLGSKAGAARGGEEAPTTPTVDGIRALLEDLGWAKELRIAVYGLAAAAKEEGEGRRRRDGDGRHRESEPLASVAQARKQWETSINDELEAIARERHQPLVREREARGGDKDGGLLIPPTPAGAPLRFLCSGTASSASRT